MSPREIFPNPKHIRALTPKSEGIVEALRSKMPISDKGHLFTVSTNDLFENPCRALNFEEQYFFNRMENAVDMVLDRIGIHNPPRIDIRSIRIAPEPILLKTSESKDTFKIHGNIDAFSNITLIAANLHTPEHIRHFLHNAAHEALHAKSKRQWTIGEKTMRYITGVSVDLGKVTKKYKQDGPPNWNVISTQKMFQGLNEAIIEELALDAYATMHDTTWFQETQSGTGWRKLISPLLGRALSDRELSLMREVSYLRERKIFSLLLQEISRSTNIPFSKIRNLFLVAGIVGTFQEITPLLRQTFGKDILRVLAYWSAQESQKNRSLLLSYLQEKNPQRRDAFAKEYLQNHNTVPQSS